MEELTEEQRKELIADAREQLKTRYYCKPDEVYEENIMRVLG